MFTSKMNVLAITIAEPDGYWTILKQNVNDPNSREVLPIRLMDYDPSE
jgi:hypothetical protein